MKEIFAQRREGCEKLKLFLSELEDSKYGKGFFKKFLRRLLFELNMNTYIGVICMLCVLLEIWLYCAITLALQLLVVYFIFGLLWNTPAGEFSMLMGMIIIVTLNARFRITCRIFEVGSRYGNKLIDKICSHTVSKNNKITEKYMKEFKNLTC